MGVKVSTEINNASYNNKNNNYNDNNNNNNNNNNNKNSNNNNKNCEMGVKKVRPTSLYWLDNECMDLLVQVNEESDRLTDDEFVGE